MKQYLASTSLGQRLINWRLRVDLVRDALNGAESAGLLANNLATEKLRNRLCQDGKIFVDVGCHIGSVVNGVRLNSRPSRIIAVEAIPEKVASLKRHFPDVEFHCCAVGPETDEVEFSIPIAKSGYASLDPALRSRKDVRLIKVPMRRLDDILPHDDNDVIKIDIEGAELGALLGAEKVVSTSRPVIIFESAPEVMQPYTKEAMFAWFADHNYALFTPDRVAHTGAPADLSVFLDAHSYPRRTNDWFAIPKERVVEVRRRAVSILER